MNKKQERRIIDAIRDSTLALASIIYYVAFEITGNKTFDYYSWATFAILGYRILRRKWNDRRNAGKK